MLCIKENLSTTCIKNSSYFSHNSSFFAFAKLSKLLFDAMLKPSFNRKFKIMAQELLAQLQAGTAKFSDVLAHSIMLRLKIKAVQKFSLLPSYKV
jgi:hypothetical protein